MVAEQLTQLSAALRINEAVSAEGGLLEERQYLTCRVLCAFAERAVDVIAQTDGRLLPGRPLHSSSNELRSEVRTRKCTGVWWPRGRTRLASTPEVAPGMSPRSFRTFRVGGLRARSDERGGSAATSNRSALFCGNQTPKCGK